MLPGCGCGTRNRQRLIDKWQGREQSRTRGKPPSTGRI